MSEPIVKIEKILKSEYSTEGFVALVTEIFDSLKIIAPDKKNKEYSNFNSHIETYSHVGSYTSPDNKKIAIFEVQLKKANYVENARSTQRSYARSLIEKGNVDGAIIAFFTPGDSKWRLSFVRLDYEMKFEGGKFKTQENLTPAKRYSFLVGKDEPCHTAISRFHNFIIDKNYNPTLDEIEEAFSVEKVTKEFFDLYCEKFYQLQEYLESNRDFREESERCGFTSEQFAKKLMGQIVFLYFLQKKGWLGVNVWPSALPEKEYKNVFFTLGAQGRIIKEHLPKIYIPKDNGLYYLNSRALDEIPDEDEEVIANHMPRIKTWGDGSKSFLRTIYKYSQSHKKHFYEEYLEPLFYDALNRNRGAMGYFPALHCRVPFLSGGLFDPIDNYDWKNNHFDIPDELFSDKKDDNDRDADGILDIFDRYNFTMSEDEPMEREVAIDPEMLGKVFENLLEVKDRKSKGAFYTPREIVHYMCQESLINYLVRKTGISETDIRDFILYGDFMKDEDTSKEKREGNGGMFISEEIFKIDADGKIVVNRLPEIDKALADVKIADPAVGSGAFPLGMMNEIVRARQNITAYMSIGMNAYNKRMLYQNERSPYTMKYNTIKNCLYAVDIEPSAVDIAQLRLWLSLVIDDEINPTAQNELEGHRDPLPLPNLECNILCGNSLVDEFKGVKLVRESDILGKDNYQIGFGHADFEIILKKLLEEQDLLFRCDDPIKKQKHKEAIQSYKDMIVSKEVQNDPTFMEEYRKAAAMSSKPFIVWELDFAHVFSDNGGFDIVIGNPPYVRVQNLSHEIIDYYKRCFNTAWKRIDISTLFIELGESITNSSGLISFISSNQFLTTEYGRKMREFLIKNKLLYKVVDFGDLPVFQNAMTYVSIFYMNKMGNDVFGYHRVKKLPFYDPAEFDGIDVSILTDEAWTLGSDSKTALMTKISERTNEKLNMYAKCWAGVITGKDEILMWDIDDRVDCIDDSLVMPVIRAQGCDRYCYAVPSKKIYYPYREKNNDTELLSLSELQERYPMTYQYVMENEDKLKSRKDSRKTFGDKKGWYGLIRFGRLSRFQKTKIVSPGEVKHNKFALDETGSAFSCARVFSITVESNAVDIYYLLAFLNSKIAEFYLHNTTSLKAGGYYSYSSAKIDALPLVVNGIDQTFFSRIVKSILEMKKENHTVDTRELEEQIDRKFYEIYGLNCDDIKCLEELLIDSENDE